MPVSTAKADVGVSRQEEGGKLVSTAQQRWIDFVIGRPSVAVEVSAVRRFGYSPMSLVYSLVKRVPYNHPLLLVTTGRKSGRQSRPAVLPWYEIDGNAVIVGSRGGTPRDPDWALNLRSNPEAMACIRRRDVPVIARLVEGDERASYWAHLLERAPMYADYQEQAKEHRIIPVFALSRRDGSPIAS
jgi:F420H(2)-dependent quinone reductase